MDNLNNILDKIHNYLILVEARNTGLIALNLGLLSFYYSSSTHLKFLVVMLCLLGTLILAISFVNIKLKNTKKTIIVEMKEEKEEDIIKSEDEILGLGSKAIKRNEAKSNSFEEKKYSDINIYRVEDIQGLDPIEYLNVVSNKMEVKGDKILNFIRKEYRFSQASLDLSKEILATAKTCFFREKIFYIGLYMFILNILVLIIDNIIL